MTAPDTASSAARRTAQTIVMAIGTAPQDGATMAALRLADAAVQRGHRVAVYAYGNGVRVGADGCPTGAYVRELVGAEPGAATDTDRAAWVVDGTDPRTTTQVHGVVLGDGGDLWRLVREADVVLGVSS